MARGGSNGSSWAAYAIAALAPAIAACSSSEPAATTDAGASDAAAPLDSGADAPAPQADWILALDPTHPAAALNPALLGHYDISGELFHYDQIAALRSAMAGVGFAEWRIGLGRWESTTLLLPTLTDGTSCASSFTGLPSQAFAPAASGNPDLALIAVRDWFSDDGATATMGDTADDSRYQLAYVRSAIDVATAFGAAPYVDLDHMPLAFAINRTPTRTATDGVADQCTMSWSNEVSNAPPADAAVFATAVAGAVARVVDGSDGVAGRPVRYWEFWNEEELPYAWATAFDDASHTRFFDTAIAVLTALDAYRNGASSADGKAIKIGLGSFANASSAAAVLAAFDAAASHPPADFFSFHSYHDDPLAIVADIQTVTAARAASTHYASAELALSEWGPDLMSATDPTTMSEPLLVATVIALGATLGLDHAHHSIFYDFYDGIPWGLVDNAGNPTALHRAYELLALVVTSGAVRLAPTAYANGQIDGGMAAVLASKGSDGTTRVLLVNRESAPHTARIDVGGVAQTPTRVRSFDDPAAAVHDVTPSVVVTVPGSSIVVVEL